MRKTKFYKRILIFQLIIVLFYTVVFSCVIYYQNNSLINENFKKENHITVNQLAARADYVFAQSDEILNDFYSNENLIKFAGSTEDFYNVKLLCEELQKIGYRESFRLGFKPEGEDLVVTHNGTSSFEYFLFVHGFDNVDFDEVKKLVSENGGTAYLDSEEYILEIKLLYVGVNLPAYAMRLYDKDELFHRLDNEGMHVLVYRDERFVAFVGEEEEREELSFIGQGGRNSDFLIYEKLSESSPFKYVFAVSKGNMEGVLRTAFLRALVMCIILELIGLAIINFSTKKIYSPIERMLSAIKLHPKPEDDEISYAIELFNELDTRNLKYEEIVHNADRVMRDKAIAELLQGIIPGEKAEEVTKKHGIRCFDNEFYLVYMRAECNDTGLEADSICILHEQLRNIIADTLRDNGIPCESVVVSLMNIIIIANGARERISELFVKICEVAEAEYNSIISCIISDKAKGIEEGHERYNEILFVREVNNFEQDMITYTDDIEGSGSVDFYYPVEMERTIISALAGGKLEVAVQTFDRVIEINTNYIKSANVNIGFLRSILISTVMRAQQFVNCGDSEEFLYAFSKVRHADTIDELNKQLKNIFAIIGDAVKNSTNSRNSGIIAEMEKIIDENLDKDIALADMAYKFNMSQSHLSELFKKYKGDNFKTYVNRKKIDRAKEILNADKNIKVKQLAEMLGFNSVNTFIKVFGKYAGMSPGQYAKEQSTRS